MDIEADKTNRLSEAARINVNETESFSGETHLFGQGMYFERVEAAGKSKALMARIALCIADETSAHPVTINEICKQIGWADFQAVLALLSLRSSTRIKWTARELCLLKRWAAEV